MIHLYGVLTCTRSGTPIVAAYWLALSANRSQDHPAGLAEQWNQTAFELGEAVVHGDAHMDNLLQSPGGRIAFVDLETVAVGPPEWDLTLTALYYECGWFSRIATLRDGTAPSGWTGF